MKRSGCHDHGQCVRLMNIAALIEIVSLRQEGDFLVRTHHVEYCDGGILDPDDVLSDLVEDKDKVRARPVGVTLDKLPVVVGWKL